MSEERVTAVKRPRGRPPRQDDYHRLGVHIPGDVADQLRQRVAASRRTMSDIVSEALRVALADEPKRMEAA